MTEINEQRFRELLKTKLGKLYDHALRTFRNYGPYLAFDVTNVLLHAVKQEKVDEVLRILDEHFAEHLKYQAPEIRGTVAIYETRDVFLRICQQTLGLKSNQS